METELYRVLINEVSPELSGQTQGGQKLDGRGRVVLKNGAVYEGSWVDGCMEGKGKLTFPDGIEYEGDFRANAMTGNGVYRWPAWPGQLGSSMYQGEVLNGKRHGQGTMSFADSQAVYKGEWANGLRHGTGTLTFNREGTHSYSGHWESDMKQGTGTMRYANGDKYEGEWAADLKCGFGQMTWKSSKQQYNGQWRDNAPNGIGTHIWFQQVSEKADANHALLIMFNRYHGHFLNGQRSGCGVMYYATGARFEGQWLADKKEGLGCFVFENGDTWRGQFAEDRPVLAEGEQFAPKVANVLLYISDLVEEEETPAAALRQINNVVMVYNSDLRTLYDMYCKRPSLHMRPATPSISNTLVVAQFWELLVDARLVTSTTPLTKISQLLTRARTPPQAVQQFRLEMCEALQDGSDPEDVRFWSNLLEDYVQGGVYNPMAEVLFPAFCEALVRVAALRYRALPGVERRLHTLITTHLMGLVSKSKHTPPPRTPMHAELWSSEATLQLLHEAQPSLRQAFAHVAASAQPAQAQQSAVATGEGPADVYQIVSSVRSVLKGLMDLGVLPDAAANLAAARAFCEDYLQANVFGHTVRSPRMWSGEDSSGEPGAEASAEDAEAQSSGPQPISEAEEREILAWLDMPLIYSMFLEGIVRMAHQAPWLQEEGLHARLAAFLQDPQTGLFAKCPRALVAG